MLRRLAPVITLAALFVLSACQTEPASTPEEDRAGADTIEGESAEGVPADGPGVFEFTAVDYGWKGPAEVPSGWVTFRMPNVGAEHHVMVRYRLPEGVTWSDWVAANEHYHETGMDPSWWPRVEVMGGPGLVAPGETARTTLHLEPGRYAMVCGVRTPEGVSHSQEGMERLLTVTEDSSGAAEPEVDLTLTLRDSTFVTEGTPRAGTQTVRVRFEEQSEPMHDVHLARLDGGAQTDDVVDWFEESQAPTPVPFLGGAEQMSSGQVAYFTVDLEPGRYAWACHGHAHRGMIEAFTVEGS